MAKKLTLRAIKKIQTLDDLRDLDLGIKGDGPGYRGGTLGVSGSRLAWALNIPENFLPPNYGVYCNYLGGGIRGALGESGYNPNIPISKQKLLDELAQAVKRVYTNLEGEAGLLDDEYPDGETNWDNLATKTARKAGVKSYPGL